MKSPFALFKKKSRKTGACFARIVEELCLFLKTKSQNLINTVARCLHKEKDVKKTVKRKIFKVKRFLKIVCFAYYLTFKNNTSLS